MERTKKKKPLWLKLGGGTFMLRTAARVRIIKPGQKFYAEEYEIPVAFKDLVELLEKGDEPEKEKPGVKLQDEELDMSLKNDQYVIEKVATGWWDVVDLDGKVMNDKTLRFDKARELLDALRIDK